MSRSTAATRSLLQLARPTAGSSRTPSHLLPRPSPATTQRQLSTKARTPPSLLSLGQLNLLHSLLPLPNPISRLALRSLATCAARASPAAPAVGRPPASQADTSEAGSGSHSSSERPKGEEGEEKVGLGGKVKQLFRTHGWTALVVYLVLGAIDFGLTFCVIYIVGAERVREFEDYVLDALEWRRKDGEPGKIKQKVTEWTEKHKSQERRDADERKAIEKEMKRLEQQQKQLEQGDGKSAYGAIASTAVLAYVIHKTALLPFRVGVTAMVTPKVVRTMQQWGWKVGYNQGAPKGADKMAAAARAAHQAAKARKKSAKLAAKTR